MPTPLRNSALEALNVAIAKGEAVFSLWTRWSIKRQMYFVGASACFEGELYDLTDVGWVARDDKECAFALSPNCPKIEGGTGPATQEADEAHGGAEMPGDEADQLEQTFVEELGLAAPETFQEQLVHDNPVVVAEIERIAQETSEAIELPPEEAPIVMTPGKARQKVQA